MRPHYGKYSGEQVLAKLGDCKGLSDERRAEIDHLLIGCADQERAHVADAVAALANTIPGVGPATALEIIAEVSRFWAKAVAP